jgi:hypothetical protein
MTGLAQVDRIISEVNNLEENEKIVFFHKIEEIYDSFESKENEDISIKSAFGLWKDRTINKEILREKAWGKN